MSGIAALCRQPDLPIPDQCQELIGRGALVAVNHSGGKDNQTMTILLTRVVPRDQLVAVHSPLGEVEWPGTKLIRETFPPSVPLILAPVASGKTLLERVEERGMWPSKSARRCTPDAKRGPIERELRRYGNKEVAFSVGARYGADGWYVPAGVDLAAFRERVWL